MNAGHSPRVATVSNVYWPGRRSDALVAALDIEGVAVSAGAACSSGKSEPSAVILAMYGAEPLRAESSIRFSFGCETSEIDEEFSEDCCRRVLSRPPV